MTATNQGGAVERNLEAQRQTIETCAHMCDRMVADKNLPDEAHSAAWNLAIGIRALVPNLALAVSPTPSTRKMVSGDLFHRSPHAFPDDCWGGGRTDCKRCGTFLNSFYDDEDGCRGPHWMRVGEDWDCGRIRSYEL